jgi:tripartite-type tricarboxylate transporter receptor subunit TctC
LPSSLSAIQAGQVRALGVAATARAGGIPDVPTFAEQGLKDQEADTLTGIVAPAGTPKEIVARLNAEIRKALADPETRQKLDDLGLVARGSSPDELGAVTREQLAKYAKLINELGIAAK